MKTFSIVDFVDLVSAVVDGKAESLPASVCTGPTPGTPGGVQVSVTLTFK